MNRSLFRIAAHLQLALALLLATGCTPTQPFFVNESPDLQHYLNAATSIEYPDVETSRLAGTTQTLPPLTVGNHDYQFWDMTLEECVTAALQNARNLPTTGGTAEFRQNIASQFVSGTPDQFGSIYDVAIQQLTTQSAPLATDGNGNRLLPRTAIRANQIGGVEDALAEFDAVTSGFIDYSTTDRPQNVGQNNIINPQQLRAYNTTQQAAISKRLATGGVATLRQQVLYSRNNTPLGPQSRAVASDYTALLEAQIQHPLMRNRGTFINRIPVVLASINEDIAIAQFESQIRNLVRDVEVAYWDLYQAYRSVASSAIARNSAQATAQFIRNRMDMGQASTQELAQAEGQFYNFEIRLKGALAGTNIQGAGDDRFGVYGRERALRELIGIPATDGRLIRPIDEPTLARVDFDWNESIAQSLYLSPEIRTRKYAIKQLELELALAKNQMLPDVNLSFLYRWVGFGDTLGPPGRRQNPFPAQGSSALGGLTQGDHQEGQVRLEVNMPVGLRREMTRVRGAQIRLKRELAFLEDQERFQISQLSDAIAKVATHYGQLQDSANVWQAFEREVETRLAAFYEGTSEVNVVLQSQQRRADAQIGYYRALTEYNKSLNYVDYIRGTLLANSNVVLREGPWNTKAYCDALERARERAAGHHLQYGVTRPAVVRTGPVPNGEAAVQMLGMSDTSQGQIVSSGDHDGQIILDEAAMGETILNDPMGLDIPMNREVPEINDQPLRQFDDQMFKPSGTPKPNGPTPANLDAMPKLSPSPAPRSVLSPNTGVPMDGSVQPMSYQSAPLSHQDAVGSGLSGVSAGQAPAPVRRKPLPAARRGSPMVSPAPASGSQ